jgi:signal transduction histidine kinase
LAFFRAHFVLSAAEISNYLIECELIGDSTPKLPNSGGHKIFDDLVKLRPCCVLTIYKSSYMPTIKRIWSYLTHRGISHLPDHNEQKRITLGVNRMAAFVIVINATIGIASCIITRSSALFTGVLTEIAAMAIPLLLNHHRKYWWGSISLFLLVSTATFYFCSVLGKLVEAQLAIVYLVGLSFFVFRDRASRIACVGISIAVVIGVELNFRFAFIRPLNTDIATTYILRASAYAVVIFLVIYTFHLYAKSNRYLLGQLQVHADQIQLSRDKEAQENRTKDKFIGNATHEVRIAFFSIYSIINHLSAIEKNTPMDELGKCIDDLRATCRYSQNTFDNTLAYVRYNAGLASPMDAQLVNIHVLLESVVSIYRHAAESRDITIDLHLPVDLQDCYLVVDEMKLRQIITNTLDNAVKFTDNRSIVSVDVSKREDQLVISIQDSGCGVDEALIGTIFEPFVTRNPHGLGLGLYIVSELVEAMNGTIHVCNRAEGGANFTISIPVREPVSLAEAKMVLS